MKSESAAQNNIAQLYKTAHALYIDSKFLEAEKLYIELLRFDANHAEALADLGTLYLQINQLTEAEACLKKSLEANPDQAFVLNNLGTILSSSNKHDEAIAFYAKATELDLNYADAFNNLGLSQHRLRQFSNAIPNFNRALEINSNYFDSRYHLALCLVQTKQFDEAEQNFKKAIALKPSFYQPNFNLGLMKLLQGDFEIGLPLYEWRWYANENKNKIRHFNKSLWLGAENIKGKTVLLHLEQGFGDFIYFCRYALELEKLGAKVILELQAPLLPLIQSLSNKFVYIEAGQALPEFDFHCPIASLPFVLSTRLNNVPTYNRYLKAPADKKQYWHQKLGKKTLTRIGIAWSGSSAYENDWKRSLPVHFLTMILRMNAEFHLLQKETKPRDWQILDLNQVKTKLINHENELHDFSDTAALIDEMDLVISVDTAIAHLAGALGKPLWLLIPYLPDFRWLLNRDDSPWYPSVKLFRQTKINDWKEIIAQLNAEFTLWLKTPNVNPLKFSKAATKDIKTSAPMPNIKAEAGDRAELNSALDLHNAGKANEAEAAYKKILAQYPNDLGANNMLGTLYLQAGKDAEAEQHINKVLFFAPNNAYALCNFAIILNNTKRTKEAIAVCEKALQIKPDFADVHNNLGSYLSQLEENTRAAVYLKRATELKADYFDAHYNLALVYYRLKKFDLAEAEFKKVIALKPDHTGVHYNFGLLKLLNGDFETGLSLYEYRWQSKEAKLQARDFQQPMWRGKENIQDKTILLHAEQGHGDVIQFCRYALEVEKLGAKVILELHQIQYELVKTLSDNFTYVLKGKPLPAFDFHCPLLSLPLAFNTRLESIPSKVPYLKVPKSKTELWKNKLGKKTMPRIGIVWTGTAGHLNDHNRSISLSQLGSLFNVDAEFHVLQKEVRASDEGALKLLQIFNNVKVHQYDLHDFIDTAALIAEMDLVISVDTSVAHLAGALAAPIWVLLAFVPDFRWLLNREDSPWYPTARLFRQTKQNDWAEVIGRVKDALNQYLLILPNRKNSHKLIAPILVDSNVRTQIDQALALHAAGDIDAAQQQIISINQTTPNNTEALTILATMYMQQNQLVAAQDNFEKSLRLDKQNALTLHNYGLLLEKLNRANEALKFINAALDLNPQYEEAYKNKVILLKKLGDTDAIIATYLAATSHIKQSANLFYKLYQYLHEANRFDEALSAINQFIALDAGVANAYNDRGNTLQALKKPSEALASYQQALALDPQHIHAISNSGNAHLILNQPQKALDNCEAALAIDPTFIAALNNRAGALAQLKRFDEALLAYDVLTELNSDNHFSYFNKAVLCLLMGDFKNGWLLYESRWQAIPNKTITKEYLSKPLWLGKAPANSKTILIHNEQGYGDMIQFCRYLPMLISQGFKQVYITAPIALYKLFADGFKQQADFSSIIVVTDKDKLPKFDLQCPIMSLPLAFNTQLENVPAKIPYLYADAALAKKWQTRIQNHPIKNPKAKKVNIGLVWTGSTAHVNDINRSITISMLADILALDAQFHCLQKEIKPDEEASLTKLHVQSYCEYLDDFAETAALIHEMDLIISVDTSVAHLVGALGKPVWILLPYMPDYRWLLDRDDSPWYPTARLFRQCELGNWVDVIERVKQALKLELKLN